MAGMETLVQIAESPCATAVTRDADWRRSAHAARRLAWLSLAVVLVEGVVGLWQGLAVGSVALTGWALGGGAEALGSGMVVWRFSGSRTLSETAERRAQRGVAVSFFLTAPYVAAESLCDLTDGHHADPSVIGMALTAVAPLLMLALGWANRRLGTRLDSGAARGEGTQNYLCAGQSAGVLAGLAVTALWAGGWWIDPTIGLGIAGIAVWEGIQSWRGHHACGC